MAPMPAPAAAVAKAAKWEPLDCVGVSAAAAPAQGPPVRGVASSAPPKRCIAWGSSEEGESVELQVRDVPVWGVCSVKAAIVGSPVRRSGWEGCCWASASALVDTATTGASPPAPRSFSCLLFAASLLFALRLRSAAAAFFAAAASSRRIAVASARCCSRRMAAASASLRRLADTNVSSRSSTNVTKPTCSGRCGGRR